MFLPVQAAYDRWSASYDAYDNPMVFMAAHALRSGLLGHVGGKRVFEFGCGTGRNLAAMLEAGARSAGGCDLSSGMLAAARARGLDARVFQHDAAQPIDAADWPGEVDVVVFSLVLEHLERLAPPLAEARRMLAPGGRIAVYEIHPFLSLSGVAAHFEDAGEEIRMPAFPHQFGAYLAAFAEAGLTARACREWRPRDLGEPAPLKAMKRGPDFPMLVEFDLKS